MQPDARRAWAPIENKENGSFGGVKDSLAEVGGGPKRTGYFSLAVFEKGLADYGFVVNFLSVEGA